MAKIFYTDHDIEDLAKKGVDEINLDESVVLTDLARDKARRLGIKLVTAREKEKSQASKSKAPNISAKAKSPSSSPENLETRVYKAVKSRLGDQVDDDLLRTIVKRVVQNIGDKKAK